MTEQNETQETSAELDATVEGSVAQMGSGAAFVPSDQPASLSPFDPSSGTLTHDSQGGNDHVGADPAVTATAEIAPIDDITSPGVPAPGEVLDTEGLLTETPETPVPDTAEEVVELLGSTANAETTVDGAVAGAQAEGALTEGEDLEAIDVGLVLLSPVLQGDPEPLTEGASEASDDIPGQE